MKKLVYFVVENVPTVVFGRMKIREKSQKRQKKLGLLKFIQVKENQGGNILMNKKN